MMTDRQVAKIFYWLSSIAFFFVLQDAGIDFSNIHYWAAIVIFVVFGVCNRLIGCDKD
jgi:EAL domain-containing protein (putative c-di-GMP-specific phosphodiesterase class I)